MNLKKWSSCVMLMACLLQPIIGYAEPLSIVTEDNPPFNYVVGNAVKGIATNILYEVHKELKFPEPIIMVYPWARAYQTVLSTPNSMIFTTWRTPERETLFKWVTPVVETNVYFYKLKSRADIVVKDINDAKKYLVGAVKDDYRATYLEKNKYKTSYTKSYIQTQMMTTGRIDLVIMDSISLKDALKNESLKYEDFERLIEVNELNVPAGFAFNLNTPDDTINKFKAALEVVKASPKYQEILNNP